MEYLTCISIPTPDVEFYSRPVGDMVRKGARVQADGIVKGKFPYVTGYININGKTEGHYFPAWVNVPGHECEIVRCSDGASAKGTLDAGPGDNFIVILMDDNKEFDIKVDGNKICHLDFSEAILEEKREEKSMNVNFFDTGTCGLMLTGHIGTLDKNSGTEVVFDKVLPVGTRMVYLIAIASDDMEGAKTVTAGNGTTEGIYANAHSIEKGKGSAAHPDLPLITSGKVGIKLDTEITKGTVDIFATVIRLAV